MIRVAWRDRPSAKCSFCLMSSKNLANVGSPTEHADRFVTRSMSMRYQTIPGLAGVRLSRPTLLAVNILDGA